MNLSQLQAAIQAKGYTADTASQQTQFINETYRKVCGMNRWPFLEAEDTSIQTVVGQTSYTLNLANPWRNIDAVRIEQPTLQNYINLKYEDPQQFMEYWHIDRDVSTPYYWTFKDQQLWFYPVPDDVYTVRLDYIIEPPDLVNPTDIPLIPVQYHDILVWGAVKSLAYRERDWLGRQFAEQEEMILTKQLQEEYLVKQRQNGSHVQKSGYWDTQLPYPFIHDGF